MDRVVVFEPSEQMKVSTPAKGGHSNSAPVILDAKARTERIESGRIQCADAQACPRRECELPADPIEIRDVEIHGGFGMRIGQRLPNAIDFFSRIAPAVTVDAVVTVLWTKDKEQ